LLGELAPVGAARGFSGVVAMLPTDMDLGLPGALLFSTGAGESLGKSLPGRAIIAIGPRD
jgi:hypothetical protein